MTKSELISRVAATTGLTRKQAGAAVEAVFGAVGDALTAGEKVTVVGFGSFGVRDRVGRVGRNPRTNKPMTISARRVPVFRAGKTLKAKVSGK
jgi:DNA-binding protein HU-beta